MPIVVIAVGVKALPVSVSTSQHAKSQTRPGRRARAVRQTTVRPQRGQRAPLGDVLERNDDGDAPYPHPPHFSFGVTVTFTLRVTRTTRRGIA